MATEASPGPAAGGAAAGPAIAVDGLVKHYGGRPVLRGLTFRVQPGEVFALLGPNGAGKTTTVEILEGYRVPDGGRVRVLGLDPVADGRALKARIGVMLQRGGLQPQIRPLEALRLFGALYAEPEEPQGLLELVGLGAAVRTPYRRLSGGQQQRLALALALVGRPALVFLDEPTAAMDAQARRETWALIRGLRRRGVTVLLTTHFMDEAERLADRVAIIARGQLIALGTPAELAGHSAGREVRFRAPPGLDTGALEAWLATPVAPVAVREAEPGQYAVEAEPTPALVARLTAWLGERDVLVSELQVGRRSLEEVYLRLTGALPPPDAAGPGADRPRGRGEADLLAGPGGVPERAPELPPGRGGARW